MKDVIIDARLWKSGGIGTYLQSLLPFLIGQDFQLQLIVSPKDAREIQDLGLKYTTSSHPIFSMQEQLQLFPKLPPCDLFWSPHYNVPLLPVRAKKRLVTIHDLYPLSEASTFTFFKRNYARMLLQKAVNTSQRVITVSQFSKREMLRYLDIEEKKIAVIPLGVDRNRFAQKEEKCAERYFLFVGNVKPHKNILGLMRAFRLFMAQGNSCHLLIVGKREGFIHGEQRADALLKEDPLLSQRVHFFTDIDNDQLPSLYRSAIATLLPSFYEGFGLTALEAMRSGCPVIASHVASLPEVCGDAAHFIDPYSVEEIARAMKQLAEDATLREQLKEKGLKRAETFCWKRTAESHLEVIKEILQT